MKRLSIIFVIIQLSLSGLRAQQIQRCHSNEVHLERYESDEEYRHQYDIRKAAEPALIAQANEAGRADCIAPIVIPIAVHYEGITNENMNCLRDLALSQIEQLNKDYSSTNEDFSDYYAVAANSGLDATMAAEEGVCIQFCLADSDHPAGFGLENGDFAITINQGYHTGEYGDAFTSVEWAGYLNMIVTNNISNDPDNSSVLGYTYRFLDADGSAVVISSCVFGYASAGCGGGFGDGTGCGVLNINYGIGRTAIHEVGHFLGLPHTWGENNASGPIGCSSDDGFADTPNSEAPNFGCPNVGAPSSSCNSQDMFMNHMDYCDDACSYMFSEEQANLMYNRASELWQPNSPKCNATITVNDASALSIEFPGNASCGTSVAPAIRLRNVGSAELTSADITYSITNGGSNTFNWTGSLNQFEVELVNLPVISNPNEAYTLTVASSNPNGEEDENPNNDEVTKNVGIQSGVALPFIEGIEDFSTFPAQGIVSSNPDEDDYEWGRKPGSSAYGEGVYSAYFDNFAAADGIGKEDWFILPEFDIANFESILISYDFAYTYFDNGTDTREDSFIIMYSYSCSNVWQGAWSDSGASLATATATDTHYSPDPDNDWVTKELGINADGNDFIRVAFVNKSGNGNSLYLDNINIVGSTDIVANTEIETLKSFSLSPNPSSGLLNVNIQFEEIMDYNIMIHDVVGREVYSKNEKGMNYQDQIEISDLSDGIYFVSIVSGNEIVTKKILLNK